MTSDGAGRRRRDEPPAAPAASAPAADRMYRLTGAGATTAAVGTITRHQDSSPLAKGAPALDAPPEPAAGCLPPGARPGRRALSRPVGLGCARAVAHICFATRSRRTSWTSGPSSSCPGTPRSGTPCCLCICRRNTCSGRQPAGRVDPLGAGHRGCQLRCLLAWQCGLARACRLEVKRTGHPLLAGGAPTTCYPPTTRGSWRVRRRTVPCSAIA